MTTTARTTATATALRTNRVHVPIVYSVSVDPPLVSFSVMKTSNTYPRIPDAGTFTVNVLSRGQKAVSDKFARRGTDNWADIQWSPTEQANPILDRSLA